MSVWDTFCRAPGKICNGSNGGFARDQYNKYQEDIDLMEQMNLDAYRFSISRSRLMRYRGSKSEVNQDGIAYYNRLINGLIDEGYSESHLDIKLQHTSNYFWSPGSH